VKPTCGPPGQSRAEQSRAEKRREEKRREEKRREEKRREEKRKSPPALYEESTGEEFLQGLA